MLHVAPRTPTTLATSPCAYPPRTAFGVYFDVRSNGPAVTLTALTGGGKLGDAAVTIWACEGSGAGKETERGAWRQVGAGTLKKRKSTRLALSPPVAVGAGATVGLLVHAAKGYVRFSKDGEAGEVDASDGAISVLKGGWCASKTPFANVRTDGCYALAGSVEYEMARCEAPGE